MSLKSFIKEADVSEILGVIRVNPELEKRISLVECVTDNPQLMGTAFDYLMRFALERRIPGCIDCEWAAKWAVESLNPSRPSGDKELFERASQMLKFAKARHDEFIHLDLLAKEKARSIAEATLLLAQLDVRRRSMQIPANFGQVKTSDIDELVELLDVIPEHLYVNEKPVLLNPTFGEVGLLVDGADADLVIGSSLIDIKTVSRIAIDKTLHNQLLGYYLLARHHRLENPSFPEIKEVGIYFSRHAYLWKMPVTKWTDHPDFYEVERRFFELAQEKFGTSATTLPEGHTQNSPGLPCTHGYPG